MNNDLFDNLGDGVLYVSGTRGYSAYEIAVQNGFVGTEEEWLESLKGETGEQGTPFDELTDEQKEEIKGEEGKSAYEIAVEQGFIGTEQDWVNSFLTPNGYVKRTDIIDNLESTSVNNPLSAKQGKILKDEVDSKIPIEDIVDNLTSTSSDKVLSAKQGKILNDTVSLKFDSDKIVVLSGGFISTVSSCDVDYPTGFDRYNSVVLSTMVAGENEIFKTSDNSSEIDVTLNNSYVHINNKNPSGGGTTHTVFRIVLMKIDVESGD